MIQLFFRIEIYRFLVSEVKAYLPPYQTINIYHCRALMDNQKVRIAQKDVKILVLPLFDGLYMDDLMDYAEK